MNFHYCNHIHSSKYTFWDLAIENTSSHATQGKKQPTSIQLIETPKDILKSISFVTKSSSKKFYGNSELCIDLKLWEWDWLWTTHKRQSKFLCTVVSQDY